MYMHEIGSIFHFGVFAPVLQYLLAQSLKKSFENIVSWVGFSQLWTRKGQIADWSPTSPMADVFPMFYSISATCCLTSKWPNLTKNEDDTGEKMPKGEIDPSSRCDGGFRLTFSMTASFSVFHPNPQNKVWDQVRVVSNQSSGSPGSSSPSLQRVS